MRLTTKIITGIILSIFLLSLLHIIGYSFTDRKNYNRFFPKYSIQIPQTDKTGIPVESHRVITLEAEQSDTDNRFWSYFANDGNGLYIHPATTSDEENKLFILEALYEFITVQTNRDTLKIKINLDEVREKYEKIDDANVKIRPSMRIGIPVSGINLYLHASNVNVINKLKDIPTRITHIETDSIKIHSLGEVIIDSCKARVIEPVTKQQLSVTHSSAKAINLDFDRLGKWNIDNCDIETRNCTGSRGDHNFIVTGKERETINWLPKNKDAALNVKFQGNAAEINFETQSINE